LRQARERPDAPALRMVSTGAAGEFASTHAFNYAQLARRSAQAAARLWHDWGIRPG
jgi:hypothetical protein